MPHALPEVRAVIHDIEGSRKGFNVDHRKTLGKYVRPCVVSNVVNRPRLAGGNPTDSGEGLRKGSEIEIDPVLYTEVLAGAPTGFAHHAEAVGIVDEHPRTVALLELADLGESGDVPSHPVYPLGHDEDAALAVLVCSLEVILQVVHVVVLERTEASARRSQDRPVDDRGMGELVHDDLIILSNERGDRTDDPEISVVEEHSSGLAKVAGEPTLERLVLLGVSGEQSRPHRGVGAPSLHRGDGRSLYLLVAGQSEVVVDGPHDYVLAAESHAGPGKSLQYRLGEITVALRAEAAEVASVTSAFVE